MKQEKVTTEVDTLYGVFKVVFDREPDMGGYMITVPKRPDIISWGKTKSHAKKMAKEAIECSVEGEVLFAAEKEGVVAIRKHRLAA